VGTRNRIGGYGGDPKVKQPRIFKEFGVRLELRPVSALLPHEETIPEQLAKITSQIIRDGIQKDPIIVHGESGTVLDGMHRLAAITNLRIENIVCFLVDYSSSGIALGRWARVYRTTKGNLVSEIIAELGETRTVTFGEALELLERRKAGLAALGKDNAVVVEYRADLDVFQFIKNLDDVARAKGWDRSFVREEQAGTALQDANNVVLLTHRLNKQDVLTAAKTKRLFPCKTSMHTIDPRPVGLDFPIDSLSRSDPASLEEILDRRSPTMLPPNSYYEGRRYRERLFLLDTPLKSK
jgi:hypothetical protein